MDIRNVEKRREIDTIEMTVNKNGALYTVCVTLDINHSSGEIEEEITTIIDESDHVRMKAFNDVERMEIIEAAKMAF